MRIIQKSTTRHNGHPHIVLELAQYAMPFNYKYKLTYIDQSLTKQI